MSELAASDRMRMLIVEDEPLMAEAIRDGLRIEAIAADIAGDACTRKHFAVLEVLVSAEGGVVSAEELLKRAWDEHADPFTNAVRITVSALRKRLGEPSIIATVPGAGYRIDTQPDTGPERADRG
jgi:two-component system, OmpR family, response regulator VanR